MTTSFDLTDLKLTAEPEIIEPEAYVAPYTDTEMPIDKALYNGRIVDGKFKHGDSDDRIPVRFGGSTSKKNGQTYLAAEFAVEVDGTVGGKPAGKKFKYGRVDTIPERLKFEKVKAGRENANTFLDLIVALGYAGRLASNEDYRTALINLFESGAVGRFSIDKDSYCNPKSNEYAGCGTSIRGEENFTGVTNDAGVLEDIGIRVACPGNHPAGSAPILMARNIIKRVYPVKK